MSDSEATRTYSVVSHTHWDREWYLPFDVFRVRLVRLIDRLITLLETEPDYRFHLDAQSIVLDDYLEIRPERRERISELVADGRILIGPWYVQNDLFLVDGESTVRNLLVGTSDSRDYGRCTYVGYTPDQFGLISQLPQILRGFDIEYCVFGRGYRSCNGRPPEFTWIAPDGSSVFAVHLPFWYNNAQRFPSDSDGAWRLFSFAVEKLSTVTSSRCLLLMNGVDHLEPQRDLLPILREIDTRVGPDDRVFQDTMPEYLDRLRSCTLTPGEHRGELRDGEPRSILAGTLSSRVSIKQANARCEALLFRWLEPLSSILSALEVREYPSGFLRFLWKLLLENHAHDGICGCSVDAVHRHMHDRFSRVEETAAKLLDHGTRSLVNAMDMGDCHPADQLIVVANTLPFPRREWMKADVDFPLDEPAETLVMLDSDGVSRPACVVDSVRAVREVYSAVNLPGRVPVHRATILFDTGPIPAGGYASFTVVSDASGPRRSGESGLPKAALSADDGGSKRFRFAPSGDMAAVRGDLHDSAVVLQNDLILVSVFRDGTCSIENKISGRRFDRICVLEDQEDRGDAYVSIQDTPGSAVLSDGVDGQVSIAKASRFAVTATAEVHMQVPVAYDFPGGRRSAMTRDCPVRISYTLASGEDHVSVDIEYENNADDHRVRLLFPNTPSGPREARSWSLAPFDIVERPGLSGVAEGDRARTVTSQPWSGLVHVNDGLRGLSVIAAGLYEYELTDEDTLAITLVRGTGCIHRETRERPHDLDADLASFWPVPDNQCRGLHRFSLVLHVGEPDPFNAEVIRLYQRAMNPPMHAVRRSDPGPLSQGRPFVQEPTLQFMFADDEDTQQPTLPRRQSLYSLEGDGLVFSCLKKAERGETHVLRFFNPTPSDVPYTLQWYTRAREIREIQLNESCGRSIARGTSSCSGIARAKAIVTLEVIP